MSSEKTAEMFKDKSEEEIMNWMIRNMTPEQIKSCFEDDLPDEPLVEPETEEDELLKLRKFCENKRYVIHKKEGDKVWFWYYEGGKWNYYNKPFNHFKEIEGVIKECGDEETVKDEIKNSLIESYISNEDEEFIAVRDEYIAQNINEGWKTTLLTGIDIQKKVPVLSDEKILLKFSPVLIESVSGNKINYYYLRNDDGDLQFIEANLAVDKFRDDLIEIINDLKLNIIMPGEAGGSSSRTVEEWKEGIKQAAKRIDSGDLERIKDIYTKFPLSKDSPFFMEDLFEMNFGNKFGEKLTIEGFDLDKIDLPEYVKNNFGNNTARLFYGKVISNKYGTKTIALVSK